MEQTLKKAYNEAQTLTAAYYEAAAKAKGGDWTNAKVASQVASKAWKNVRIAERAVAITEAKADARTAWQAVQASWAAAKAIGHDYAANGITDVEKTANWAYSDAMDILDKAWKAWAAIDGGDPHTYAAYLNGESA